jgi:hypothetical protein
MPNTKAKKARYLIILLNRHIHVLLMLSFFISSTTTIVLCEYVNTQ